MNTPFDVLVEAIRKQGFHNHRRDEHSSIVSHGILQDLRSACEPFKQDFSKGVIKEWLDYPSPGGRARKLDLVVAEPSVPSDEPDLNRLRLCLENKSVITAHRNRTNRYDDLSDVVGLLHQKKPDAILVSIVLVGLAEKVLNVPDRVKPFFSEEEFKERILPRLSSGDGTLWSDFPKAVSCNRQQDPEITVKKFRELGVRPPGRTDMASYDWVLLVPVFIDNVNPPYVVRDNRLGIDVDADYRSMLESICKAYTARWHW